MSGTSRLRAKLARYASQPTPPPPRPRSPGRGFEVHTSRIPLPPSGDAGERSDAFGLLAGVAGLGVSDLGDALFFDIEASGLGGGAGVVPFMLGSGRLVPGGVEVVQHLLTDPGAESAMLADFADRAAKARGLVTFCGKGFDAPRLRDRARYHRLDDPLPDAFHLDLYPPLRRIFGHRLRRCSLQSLERNVLGVVREDDLPSAECPGAWFSFLRTGSRALIDRVLDHNRIDIVTLPRLARELARRAAGTKTADDAIALAAALVRERRHAEADELLREAPASGGGSRLEVNVRIALAIYLEHRAREPERARDHAVIVLSLLRRRAVAALTERRRTSLLQATDRRLARLARKLSRARARSLSQKSLPRQAPSA